MLKVSVTFSVLGALKIFDLIYVLTNGGPVRASEVPSTLMVKTIFLSYQYGYGSAMAVFIIAECFIFAFLVGKIFHAIGADDL
jgi:raffinose/stachyose/melibiose transport system permease protein